MKSYSPITGELLEEYDTYSDSEVTQRLNAAEKAFKQWKLLSVAKRCALFEKVEFLLRERADELAELITSEMGKPLEQAKAEVEKCADGCRYYLDHAEKMLANTAVDETGYVTYQPLGVILGVMPWNFPFWQVLRYAIPTLIAGNTTLLKHASNVPGCALAIDELFKEAGFPKHVFQTLLVEKEAIPALIGSPIIKAVTLTGSTQAGKSIAKLAGQHLKKCVLELGGSDPYIVLDDADLEQAAHVCLKSRMNNAGQSCIAAKRLIVVEAVKQQFEDALLLAMKDITIGPMARIDLRDDLHEQVANSISQGAKCLLGGQIPDTPGAFYPPTLLTDVTKGQLAYREELFGPVVCVLPAKDQDHAIEIANDTAFGLGAAVFTKDLEKGRRLAETHIDAGNCFVNQAVESDPRFPFGGIKVSGYGRELGEFGIKEFVNIKTVRIFK